MISAIETNVQVRGPGSNFRTTQHERKNTLSIFQPRNLHRQL